MPPTAERLARALAGLAVVVDDVDVDVHDVAVPSYPDGPRPSSVVTLRGGGARGVGEHVGWTREAHEGFAGVAPGLARGAHAVGSWCAAMRVVTDESYDRAALEAAVIDLALRQNETTMFSLADVAPRPVRYVVSIGVCEDPAAAAAAEPGVGLKIDVDARWSDETLAALASTRRVTTIDWKTTGDAEQHARFAAAFPSALIEDPGGASGRWRDAPWADRVSADGWLSAPDDLVALPARPAAVNVKPGRMGGVLAALELGAAAEAAGIATYVGGMFEVGPGRAQAQAIAAVLSPDGPNDVAPITVGEASTDRPDRLEVSKAVGFGNPGPDLT